jgi:hypothetical protein
MNTRDRRDTNGVRPNRQNGEPDAPATAPGGQQGNAFLDAADAAIQRALSGKPDRFLEQNRQQGGQ